MELLKESFVQRKGVLRKRDATEKCSAFRTKGSTYVENEMKSRIEWRFERILVVCGEVVVVNTAEANRMQERRYRGREASRVEQAVIYSKEQSGD